MTADIRRPLENGAVGRLQFTAICSLDGYVADADGRFDWSQPDEEVHAFVNDLARPLGTYLLGRRMYEVLVAWETMPAGPEEPAAIRDYAAIWKGLDKVVYSTTLEEVSSDRTRIERSFDPEEVRRMKDEAGADLSVGGPHLAAEALRDRLVDEIRLFVNPVVVGGGTAALPDSVHIDLRLLDERRFGNGVVYLRYAVG
jgi:dihydrofolate reductase